MEVHLDIYIKVAEFSYRNDSKYMGHWIVNIA